MKKTIFVGLLLTGLAGGLRAQFFKKILDNVKQTTQNRANNKASQTTDKAIDGVLQPGAGKTGGSTTGSNGGAPPIDTSGISRVLGAFAGAAAANPNDTSAADLTMKALGRLVGGGGVSPADSAAAIKTYMTAQGGSGIFYQSTTTSLSKGKMAKDTNTMYMTNAGEGRSEMGIPIPGVKMNKMIILGRVAQPQYSIMLEPDEKTYSLNVIDTALFHSGKYRITRVGEETIDGYPCIHAKMTETSFNSSSTTDVWTSTAVPGYAIYKRLTTMAGSVAQLSGALDKAGCGGFMVKMSVQGKDYSMIIELMHIEEKNVPASLLRIPSDYKLSDENMVGHMFRGAKKN